MMVDMLDKKAEFDVLDWLVIGKHYSNLGEEEIAYQAYYMAHLLDHTKIGANSSLQFETISQEKFQN